MVCTEKLANKLNLVIFASKNLPVTVTGSNEELVATVKAVNTNCLCMCHTDGCWIYLSANRMLLFYQ